MGFDESSEGGVLFLLLVFLQQLSFSNWWNTFEWMMLLYSL